VGDCFYEYLAYQESSVSLIQNMIDDLLLCLQSFGLFCGIAIVLVKVFMEQVLSSMKDTENAERKGLWLTVCPCLVDRRTDNLSP
jgi:hypothetical protein